MTILDCNENDRKLSKRVKNTVGKREIGLYEQFLLFSSTGHRPASLCHGLLSAMRPCVCPSCVRLTVRRCVNFFFKHLLL